LLDFSMAVTGNLFFVPAVPLLENLGAATAPAGETASGDATTPAWPGSPGSLNIGSLKGAPGDG
jgi:porphyrinogen peroxidase